MLDGDVLRPVSMAVVLAAAKTIYKSSNWDTNVMAKDSLAAMTAASTMADVSRLGGMGLGRGAFERDMMVILHML
jgi:hypothetical protein